MPDAAFCCRKSGLKCSCFHSLPSVSACKLFILNTLYVFPVVRRCKLFNSNELFTITEFCKAVCISRRSYFRLRAEGQGPRVTILGGVHLISHDETRRWVANHTERNWIDV
jgi:hypothetical protein